MQSFQAVAYKNKKKYKKEYTKIYLKVYFNSYSIKKSNIAKKR